MILKAVILAIRATRTLLRLRSAALQNKQKTDQLSEQTIILKERWVLALSHNPNLVSKLWVFVTSPTAVDAK